MMIWLLTALPACRRVTIGPIASRSGRGGRGRGMSRGRMSSHRCSVCLKTFTSEVYLRAHQQSHAGTTGEGDPDRGHPATMGVSW